MVSIYGLENCLSLGDNYYTCSDPDTHVTLLPDGSVEAFANSFLCHVCINGNYQCYVHFR